MRFAILLASLAPSLASAYSTPFCLTDNDATTISNNFAQLISNYSKPFADQFLNDKYTDQTDSVATLINSGTNSPVPLGSLTFPSKSSYENAQNGQPDIPFKVLNVWHTCNTTIFRWVSKMSPQQVQGITITEVVQNPNKTAPKQFKYQALTTYGEFNSGAWLADLGRPECNKTSS